MSNNLEPPLVDVERQDKDGDSDKDHQPNYWVLENVSVGAFQCLRRGEYLSYKQSEG